MSNIVNFQNVGKILFGILVLSFTCGKNISVADAATQPNTTTYYKLAPAAKLDGGKAIHITSGTGFFVTNNAIITNEHVVQGCKKIKIRGAVESREVTITDVDAINDLALLYSPVKSLNVASLRGDAPIKIGEQVNVMGYPMERGIKGTYLVRKATITNNLDVYGGVERVQFTDSVEKGNSGGPLLDTSGTVIGVIVGKMSFYPAGTDTKNSAPMKISSVAITLGNLKTFLDKNRILFHTDDINYAFSDSYMENKAKEYIVNVQCIKD